MSDPLSIAASVAGVVTLGVQIAQGLHQIADGIGSAGVEVRIYAKEVSSFSKVLELIRTKVLRPVGVTIDELALVKDITGICEEVLAPLTRLQETLKPLLDRYRNSEKKTEQFGKRIHWYFSQKQKLMFYRDALRGHQQNLDTVLAAMNYDATRDIANQMALRNTLLEGVVITSRFQGGTVWKQVLFEPQPSAGLLPPIPSEHEPEEEDTPQPAQDMPLNDDTLPAESIDSQKIITTIPSDSGDNLESLTELELQEIDDAVDRDLDLDQGSSALVLWEDIRVTSRKTKRFAEAVLQNTENTVISSPEATAGPSPRNSIRDEEPNATPNNRSDREGMPHGSSNTRRLNSLKEDTVPMPSVNSSTPAPSSSSLEISDRAQETMRRSLDDRTLQDYDPRKEQNITLLIPSGDLFEFPFQKARLLEGIVSVVRSAYFGDDEVFKSSPSRQREYYYTLDDHIRQIYTALENGEFFLKGPQGQIIMPQVWDSVVKPGWQISLVFKDRRLNEREIKRNQSKISPRVEYPPKLNWWKKVQKKF